MNTNDLYIKILCSSLDQVTKVHLFKIVERGPTAGEMFLITQLLNQNERHKSVDDITMVNLNSL